MLNFGMKVANMNLLKIFLLFLIGACTPTSLELSLPANYADSSINAADYQEVHIEIEPPGQPAQVFYLLHRRDLAAGVSLRPTMRLHGFAQGASKYLDLDNAVENHNSMARFSDMLALPRANKTHFLSPRMPAVVDELASDQSFDIDLLQGLSYTLVLNPSGLYDRAPLYWHLEQLPSEARIAFNLDEFGQFITGQIRFIGAKKDQWQVRIVQANRLISSVSPLKKNGHFLVELSQQLFLGDSVPITVIIEPCDPESALPRFVKSYSLNELLNQPNLGKIDLGRLAKPLTANFNISGPGHIILKGLVGHGEVHIKKAINSEGATTFKDLYEGSYEIAIVPPPHSPWGMRVIEKVDVSGPVFNINLKWIKRQVLNAKVINANNKKVSGAQIEFTRIGKTNMNEVEEIFSDMPFSFTATTNSLGEVCQPQFGVSTAKTTKCEGLALDEGRYVAHIIPPPGSPYTHEWRTFDFPLTQNLELKLLESQKLTGKIFAADQISPMKQAYITIYAGDSNLYNQPKILANAITDGSGTFKAYVPVFQKSH